MSTPPPQISLKAWVEASEIGLKRSQRRRRHQRRRRLAVTIVAFTIPLAALAAVVLWA